jgi:hypothetical protein
MWESPKGSPDKIIIGQIHSNSSFKIEKEYPAIIGEKSN